MSGHHKPVDAVSAVIRRLGLVDSRSDQAAAGLERLIRDHLVHAKAGEDLIYEGDSPGGIKILLNGWAFRYKSLEDGRRQITSFVLPTDICNASSFLVGKIDYSIGVLSNAVVADLPRHSFGELVKDQAALRDMLWRQMVIDGAVEREWIVNLGRRIALERVAHLLCEIFERLRAAGLVDNTTCDLPATQTHLADATGLSVVHLNRTLQDLRAANLITLREKTLTIHDYEGLKTLAMFDPAYLSSN